MSYADRTRRPPRTLTDDEQRRVLRASGAHADTFRDHVIISLALGTGLRQGEIVALDVGDVSRPSPRGPRALWTIRLRHYARKGKSGGHVGAEGQVVHLPDGAHYKLDKYLRLQRRAAAENAPLFEGRTGERLSTRRLREIWREWQQAADFDHFYPFHSLRHTAITNAYLARKDIRIAQQVARHARLDTTTRYEHASAQEVAAAVKGLPS